MNITGKQILIIDDDFMSEVIKNALISEGHDVRIAYTGHVGLAMFAQEPCDVVFVGHQLPDRPGSTVAKEIRERVRDQVVVMTVPSRPTQPLPDVSQVIVKPFTLEDFRDAVRDLDTR